MFVAQHRYGKIPFVCKRFRVIIKYLFQAENECRSENAMNKNFFNDNRVRKRFQSKKMVK